MLSSTEDMVADLAIADRPRTACIALAGNPNAGKSTLFNALTGLRARTGNFTGTTVEFKAGALELSGRSYTLLDLPGMYSLRATTKEEEIARDLIRGQRPKFARPSAMVVVVDADNLERNLFLVSQLLEEDVPVVVALNMIDVAKRHGIRVDARRLARDLTCPVVPIVAKTGEGVSKLLETVEGVVTGAVAPHDPSPVVQGCQACDGCAYKSRYAWTESIASKCVETPGLAPSRMTEKIDRYLTHPIMGIVAFCSIMLGIFYLIFSVATVPMDLIDGVFSGLGRFVSAHVPAGDFQSLLVDGVIGGVGGILVFLPQICILFFVLALLEDSGYLARAAFVMDRLMRRVGLPGTAFVPMVSAHACAIPAIMATRVIGNPRDRLVTILVAPLMTCSARIPVYALVAALLFSHDPFMASAMFVGAYVLGIVAALGMAWVFKKTILPGESKPLVLELPGYKIPDPRNVLLYTFDRAKVFVQQAGTVILVISVILWGLATYPKSDEPAEALAMQTQATTLMAAGETEAAEMLLADADHLINRTALELSMAGRLGKLIEPVVAPLGFDWQIGIGVISSFAAREVIVSTLAIVYGIGEDAAEEDANSLYGALRSATRNDGSPVFTTATCASLLVFYVLAMQCLPTQAVTKRETNSWKWAAFQLAYMTVLAYGCAFIAYQGLHLFGIS